MALTPEERRRQQEEAQRRHAQDQAITEAGKVMPGLWWSLFKGCIEEGFSRQEAMEILKTYIQGTCIASVQERPPEPPRKDEDDDA